LDIKEAARGADKERQTFSMRDFNVGGNRLSRMLKKSQRRDFFVSHERTGIHKAFVLRGSLDPRGC